MNPGIVWSEKGAELKFMYSAKTLTGEYLYVFALDVDDEWEAKIAVYERSDDAAKAYAIEASKAKLYKYRLAQWRADCWNELCLRLWSGDISNIEGSDELRKAIRDIEKEERENGE